MSRKVLSLLKKQAETFVEMVPIQKPVLLRFVCPYVVKQPDYSSCPIAMVTEFAFPVQDQDIECQDVLCVYVLILHRSGSGTNFISQCMGLNCVL